MNTYKEIKACLEALPKIKENWCKQAEFIGIWDSDLKGYPVYNKNHEFMGIAHDYPVMDEWGEDDFDEIVRNAKPMKA